MTKVTHTRCVFCKQPFSAENVFTELGAKEVAISGSCEKCWDELVADVGEEDESIYQGEHN